MNEGMGRKKLDRVTYWIAVRVTPEEREAIKARLGKRGVAPVARRALFAAAGLPDAADREGIPRPDEPE